MREEKLRELLNELADATAEAVRPGLAEDIKHQIPHSLAPHRGGLDTINIMIDLRVSKLTAAAVIIITIILLGSFLGGREPTGEGIFQDSKMLVRHLLGSDIAARSKMLAGMSNLYEYLRHEGKDVVYYGDSIDPKNDYAVVMQWKITDGEYKVILMIQDSLELKTVSAEELIELQARMLQKKTR